MVITKRKWIESDTAHPDCPCKEIHFGLSTVVYSPDAPSGGIPGNACACGRTWIRYHDKKTWQLASTILAALPGDVEASDVLNDSKLKGETA